MSARMAAATGNPSWEARYQQHVTRLDEAIKDCSKLDPQVVGAFVAQTDLANQELVDFENKAFELVHRNDSLAASAILSSPEYARQKHIYAEGIQKLNDTIVARANDAMEDQRVRVLIVFATLLGVMAVVALFSAAVFRSRKRQAQTRNNLKLET